MFTLLVPVLFVLVALVLSTRKPRLALILPAVFAFGLAPPFQSPAPIGGLFTFDLSQYMAAAVNGTPILFVVIGLVEFIKTMGATGKALRGWAMGLGTVFGALYQFSQLGTPGTFADGFAMAVYGLGLGVLSFWSYDLAGSLIEKAVAKVLGSSGPPNPIE